MAKMIPYEKLSKREKKAYDARRRVVWEFSPVTRKKESGKAYDRRKARKWAEDVPFAALLFCAFNGVLPHNRLVKEPGLFKAPNY